jgi:hypothetical protein
MNDRYAVVKGDKVVNVIKGRNLDWPNTVQIKDEPVSIGWSYVDGVFAPPPVDIKSASYNELGFWDRLKKAMFK